jgi:hypothetical protein
MLQSIGAWESDKKTLAEIPKKHGKEEHMVPMFKITHLFHNSHQQHNIIKRDWSL